MSSQPDTAPDEYNARIIHEFRANQGHVGGVWEATTLLLLHHVGARSGLARVNPVGYLPHEGRHVVFASNGGASRSPSWYHNHKAQPNTRIEVEGETVEVIAEEATGEERERLFGIGAARFPQLHEHARKTDRLIPVVVITPRAAA